MVSSGFNFNAINVKMLQNIGDIVAYNLWEFQIDSSQIELYSAKIP